MATMTLPASCSACDGTVYVRVDLDGGDAPELRECCDVCGSSVWLEDAADLEERAADIIEARGT